MFTKTSLYRLLSNVTYAGKIKYKNEVHPGEQTGTEARLAHVPVKVHSRRRNRALCPWTDPRSRQRPQAVAGSPGTGTYGPNAKGRVDEVAKAWRVLDLRWPALTPEGAARLVDLVVERVDYDGAKGKVAITYRPEGIRQLVQEWILPTQEKDP